MPRAQVPCAQSVASTWASGALLSGRMFVGIARAHKPTRHTQQRRQMNINNEKNFFICYCFGEFYYHLQQFSIFLSSIYRAFAGNN